MFGRTRRFITEKVMTQAKLTRAGRALTLSLLLAVAGCGDADDDQKPQGSTAPVVSAATGSTGGEAPVAIAVIEFGSRNARPPKRDTLRRATTPSETLALRRQLFAGTAESHPWAPVDFTKDEIVAVLLASGGGGESVKIDDIDRESESATVRATHVVPGDGCVVAAVITAPFSVVSTRRLPDTVKLEIKTKRRDC